MQNINAEHCLENDSVETIDVVTKTKKVESCTNLTVYKIVENAKRILDDLVLDCLLYTSPSPRDATLSRMPSSA